MKRILLICIAVLWTTAFAQAEDEDGGMSHNSVELLELGVTAGACTTLIDLGEFAIKEMRSDEVVSVFAFVNRFTRQFLDKHHKTTLWEMCASIEDEYAVAEKRLGIKDDDRT